MTEFETSAEWFLRASSLHAEETHMLREYDLYREPLLLVHPDEERTLILRKLNQELTCSICLCIINSCSVVKECLHRFCHECITKYLRVGKKECPTCRAKCTSQRHLRPDRRFDKLIEQMYPDLEAHEREQEKIIEEINSSYDVEHQRMIRERMERQQAELQKQLKFEEEFQADPYQINVRRGVGRPSKKPGPGRPAKRGPGRPPKHPRPSNELSEKQLLMLCKERDDTYHHKHAGYVPPTQVENETTGMIIINILPKHTKSGKSLITAVNRSTTAKDLASYAKSQLGVKGNLRFYKSTKTSETLSPNSILHTLPENRIYYTAK